MRKDIEWLRGRVKEMGIDLTERKLQILFLIIKGFSSKEVGQRLFITEKAVKYHLTSLYRTFGCRGESTLCARIHMTLKIVAPDFLLSEAEVMTPYGVLFRGKDD